QLARGRTDLALVVAERARLVAWPVTMPHGGAGADAQGAAVSAAQRRLPRDVAVVELAVLDNRLLTWVIQRDRTHFFNRPLGRLQVQVEAFWRALAGAGAAGAALAAMAEELYRELVAPWGAAVPVGGRLVFVPDRFLYRLPFAALRDP